MFYWYISEFISFTTEELLLSFINKTSNKVMLRFIREFISFSRHDMFLNYINRASDKVMLSEYIYLLSEFITIFCWSELCFVVLLLLLRFC